MRLILRLCSSTGRISHQCARLTLFGQPRGQPLTTQPAPRSFRRFIARETARYSSAQPSRTNNRLSIDLSCRSNPDVSQRSVLQHPRRSASTSTSSSPGSSLNEVNRNVSIPEEDQPPERRESPWTIPNALTVARIISCPWLGYEIVIGNYGWATGILFASGMTDWLDGWIARRWSSKSVLGSILDPAADKLLGTTLVLTMAWKGLIPAPLVILILGRDVALSAWAFYLRYSSLPQPRTLSRYWDPRIPSAQVTPTALSKFNTFAQLVLFGGTLGAQLLPYDAQLILTGLQWTVGATTLLSGLDYLRGKGFKVLTPSIRSVDRKSPPNKPST